MEPVDDRVPNAVIFDLEGVLVDSEELWNESKEDLVREAGGCWREEAPRAMMGMSSGEWSTYIRDELFAVNHNRAPGERAVRCDFAWQPPAR